MSDAQSPSLEPLLTQLHTLDLRQLPAVEQRARLLVLDTLACTVAGLARPEPAGLAGQLANFAPGNFVWPGSTAGLAPAEAA